MEPRRDLETQTRGMFTDRRHGFWDFGKRPVMPWRIWHLALGRDVRFHKRPGVVSRTS